MTQYIISRLMQGLLALIVVSIAVFLLNRVAPGDIALMIIAQGIEEVTREDVDPLVLQRVESKLGLNEPVYMQYLDWMGDLVTLNWGTGFYTSKPIKEEFNSRIPITFQLGLYSVLISIFMGVPIGILMALKQDTWMDYVGRIVSLAGLSLPNFWVATVVIAMGVYFFSWSPRIEYAHPWDDLNANLVMLFWPALIGGLASGATKARMMRSTMLEVLRQDYIRTAHAKGFATHGRGLPTRHEECSASGSNYYRNLRCRSRGRFSDYGDHFSIARHWRISGKRDESKRLPSRPIYSVHHCAVDYLRKPLDRYHICLAGSANSILTILP